MSRIYHFVASTVVFSIFLSVEFSVFEINSLTSELSNLEKALLAVCFLLIPRFIYCTENCWRSNIVCHDRSSVLPQLGNGDFFYCEVIDVTITFIILVTSFIYLFQSISINFSCLCNFLILIINFFVLRLQLKLLLLSCDTHDINFNYLLT